MGKLTSLRQNLTAKYKVRAELRARLILKQNLMARLIK
jgi:hypothetical protein